MEAPLRPTQYAEQHILTAILDGTYPPGTVLPNERTLALKIGITRPTLRETLQRLSGEGWISIHQGKPTRVNTYWAKGGLKMLGTMARYGEHLPNGFITDLLEFRCVMFPPVATLAVTGAPDEIVGFLKRAERLPETSDAFASYDWNLQLLMAASCGNPIYKLILNDFNALFKTMALEYFSTAIARSASRRYYRKLIRTIGGEGSNVETVARRMMEQSIEIWKDQKKERERYD